MTSHDPRFQRCDGAIYASPSQEQRQSGAQERIASALERIAAVLERAHPPTVQTWPPEPIMPIVLIGPDGKPVPQTEG